MRRTHDSSEHGPTRATSNAAAAATARRHGPRRAKPTTRRAWSRASARTSRFSSIPAAARRPADRLSDLRRAQRATAPTPILICHALTGDQHVANTNPVTGKPGWWSEMVGPGKPIDTDRYFVICSNVVGGCMGTTGPASTNPATGPPLRPRPAGDHRRATWCGRRRCCSTISASRRFSRSLGGSLGGMQVLQWAATYPDRVFSRRCRSPPARAIPRRTSPSTRSAARR